MLGTNSSCNSQAIGDAADGSHHWQQSIRRGSNSSSSSEEWPWLSGAGRQWYAVKLTPGEDQSNALCQTLISKIEIFARQEAQQTGFPHAYKTQFSVNTCIVVITEESRGELWLNDYFAQYK